MDQLHIYEELIHQLETPAFIVHNGIIHSVNSSAESRTISAGTPIKELLHQCADDYEQLTSGCLYLTLSITGIIYPSTVTVMENCQLFKLMTEETNNELKALSLAAEQLRFPISDISLMIDRTPQIPEEKRQQINQSLYKLYRLLGNMSDASWISNSRTKLEQCNLQELFSETLEKAASLLSHSRIELSYTVPQQPIYGIANRELLSRGIYNMLSNAAKYAGPGSQITATAQLHNEKVYFSVLDSSAHVPADIRSTLFTRYIRQPGLEDPRNGLGLGMTLIHAAAATHGGTVLVETPENGGMKVTMTIAVQKRSKPSFRSPILSLDIYGGKDQALIELSDVLPYQLFDD